MTARARDLGIPFSGSPGPLNAVTDGAAGMQQFAGDATLLYYMSEEAQEGRDAFKEKRSPDFARFPRRP